MSLKRESALHRARSQDPWYWPDWDGALRRVDSEFAFSGKNRLVHLLRHFSHPQKGPAEGVPSDQALLGSSVGLRSPRGPGLRGLEMEGVSMAKERVPVFCE